MALHGIVSSPFSQPLLGLIQGIFLQYCFSRPRRACSSLWRFSWLLLLLLLEVLASVSSLSLSASVKPSLENIILCYIRRYRSLSVDTTMQTNVAKSFVIPPRKDGTHELLRSGFLETPLPLPQSLYARSYGDIITKFTRVGGLPKFLRNGCSAQELRYNQGWTKIWTTTGARISHPWK